MKQSLLILFLICSLFSNAQTGWKWGTGSGLTSNGDVEAGFLAVGKAGALYTAGNNMGGDSILFGTLAIHNPGHFQQLFLTRSDSSGFMWVKCTQGGPSWPLGVATDDSGFIYVLAWTNSAVTIDTFHISQPGATASYSYLVKVAPSGGIVWAKAIDLSVGYAGLCTDHNGNSYISGGFSGTSFNVDAISLSRIGTQFNLCLLKIDRSGTAVSAKNFGTNILNSGRPVLSEGNVYVAGYIHSGGAATFGSIVLPDTFPTIPGAPQDPYFIAKLDSNFTPVWAKEFERHVRINKITADVNGAVYYTGYTDSACVIGTTALPYYGGKDIIIGKLSPAGDFSWEKEIGGTSSDIGYDITTDLCGNSWISCQMGNFFPSVDSYVVNFNGVAVTMPYAHKFDPVLLAEYDPLGNNINYKELYSGGDDYSAIVSDNNGSFYFCGDYYGTSLIIGPDSLPNPPIGECLVLAKYTYDLAGCVSLNTSDQGKGSADDNIKLYPNPAYSDCFIATSDPFGAGASIKLYDVTGRLLKTVSLSGNAAAINLDGLTNGVYQCIIDMGKAHEVVTRKLVVIR